MSGRSADELDRHLERFEQRLPDTAAKLVRWMRGPSSSLVRIPLGLLLIGGGIIGFLPILGFWMIPLGMVLIAQDVRFLRPPLARLFAWIERKWPAKQSAPTRSRASRQGARASRTASIEPRNNYGSTRTRPVDMS
jgi:hypothetical protein